MEKEQHAEDTDILSVPDQIFSRFVDEIETMDGFKDISHRLRCSLLSKDKITEQKLKDCLFGEDNSAQS